MRIDHQVQGYRLRLRNFVTFFETNTVPTQNSDIFVRPNKVALFWKMSLF